MVTTIQLSENVKGTLDGLKSNGDTYEQVIVNLIVAVEKYNREQDGLLIEGCKVMAEDMVRINKEWEVVDSNLGWEWNDD